jgi:excisionase family DNA binding protein
MFKIFSQRPIIIITGEQSFFFLFLQKETGDSNVILKPENVMTVEECAHYLKISRSTIYMLAQEGRIPCQKVGRHWRFLREAIDSWLTKSAMKDELHAKVSET